MSYPTLWYFGQPFDWELTPNDSYKSGGVTDTQEMSQIAYHQGVKYFVKVQHPNNPELPFVEYLCNMIAHQIGLGVSPFGIVSLNGKYSFVSRDFLDDGKVYSKFLYDFVEPGMVQMEQVIHSVLSHKVKPSHILPMFAVWMYDALIGNDDRHAWNMMFIEFRGDWILAPAYDNHSYLGLFEEPLIEAPRSSRPHIGTNTFPTIVDVIIEAQRLGFDVSFYKNILKQKNEVLKLIKNFHPISRARKTALRKHISHQYKLLEEYYERINK